MSDWKRPCDMCAAASVAVGWADERFCSISPRSSRWPAATAFALCRFDGAALSQPHTQRDRAGRRFKSCGRDCDV